MLELGWGDEQASGDVLMARLAAGDGGWTAAADSRSNMSHCAAIGGHRPLIGPVRVADTDPWPWCEPLALDGRVWMLRGSARSMAMPWW